MSKVTEKKLIDNKVLNYDPGEIDFLLLSKSKKSISDNDYFDFVILSQNCGFFYRQSLHLYGHSSVNQFNDIHHINSLLQNEFGEIITGLFSFGQDLFGNQFCFDIEKGGIVFFCSETGEREIISSGFSDWINLLHEKLEYFTGMNTLQSWILNNEFYFNQRLYPAIPFIMGGEYKINNLFASALPDYLKAYANITRQVDNLPDGTPVKLNIIKNNPSV